jgi:homoserine kinase
MTSAAAHMTATLETLDAQRVHDSLHDRLVQRYRQVQVPGSETAMLGVGRISGSTQGQ